MKFELWRLRRRRKGFLGATQPDLSVPSLQPKRGASTSLLRLTNQGLSIGWHSSNCQPGHLCPASFLSEAVPAFPAPQCSSHTDICTVSFHPSPPWFHHISGLCTCYTGLPPALAAWPRGRGTRSYSVNEQNAPAQTSTAQSEPLTRVALRQPEARHHGADSRHRAAPPSPKPALTPEKDPFY